MEINYLIIIIFPLKNEISDPYIFMLFPVGE